MKTWLIVLMALQGANLLFTLIHILLTMERPTRPTLTLHPGRPAWEPKPTKTMQEIAHS